MKSLKLIGIILFLFLITGCKKKDEFENLTTNAQITGFVPEKCYCCWGWVIKISSDTIKTEFIPNLEYQLENIVFPINARIKIGSKTIDCAENKFDYYEILEFNTIE
jgi:hypothetical protein